LFSQLGLEHSLIKTILQDDSKPCVLLLLIEWARNPDSSYRQLADALHKQIDVQLDFEKVNIFHSENRLHRISLISD